MKRCVITELDSLHITVDPENQQDDFWITVSFSLVWYSPHVQGSRFNH